MSAPGLLRRARRMTSKTLPRPRRRDRGRSSLTFMTGVALDDHPHLHEAICFGSTSGSLKMTVSIATFFMISYCCVDVCPPYASPVGSVYFEYRPILYRYFPVQPSVHVGVGLVLCRTSSFKLYIAPVIRLDLYLGSRSTKAMCIITYLIVTARGFPCCRWKILPEEDYDNESALRRCRDGDVRLWAWAPGGSITAGRQEVPVSVGASSRPSPSCSSTMPSKQPQLGSLAIQAPTLTPKTVHVSSSTCHDVSAFKGGFYQRRRSLVPLR